MAGRPSSDERDDIGLSSLTSSQLRRARDAINILSSLPFDGGPNHSGTVDNGSQPHFSGASSLPSNGREAQPIPPSCSASSRHGDIRARCDSALSRLENIRDRPRFGTEARGIIRQTRKRAAIFFDVENKKRKKGMTWKHKFFCLAYVGQTRLPANEAQREELFEAGLGEKEVEFDNIDISTDEFKEVLFFNYPKLREAGGFQICRCVPNSRKLEPLASRVLSSPVVLRQRIGNSRAYIVPLQKDLDLTPNETDGPSIMEKCLTCGVKSDVSELPEHREVCKLPKKPDLATSSDDDDFETLPVWKSTSGAKESTQQSAQESVHVDLTNDEEATEVEIVQSVVAESLFQSSPVAPPYSPLTPQNENETLDTPASLVHNLSLNTP